MRVPVLENNMKSPAIEILLCLIIAQHVAHGSPSYQVFNYTWATCRCFAASLLPPMGLQQTTFIKSQVDSALRKPVTVLYHQLNANGSCDDPPSTVAHESLRFSTFATDIKPQWDLRVWRYLQGTRP